jgi:hypothetical protein
MEYNIFMLEITEHLRKMFQQKYSISIPAVK